MLCAAGPGLPGGFGAVIALIQRVSKASVSVAGESLGTIGPGLLVFVCAQRNDTAAQAERLAERVLGYRVFGDGAGRMNRSVADVDGGLLLVPQFTLAADTHKGKRPGLGRAASPDAGERLFDAFVTWLRQRHSPVETGRFGAYMQVALVNDGPVTFWLEAQAVSSRTTNTED